jgi:hypothetical protein
VSDLYLVAHKVRGEPAFDVAIRLICPHCEGQCGGEYIECHECDSLGFWWIIPTSGHRAYPYFDVPLDALRVVDELLHIPMPPSLPDHYRTREEPRIDLAKALGLKPKPLPPIVRRL